jgi:protease YdgD
MTLPPSLAAMAVVLMVICFISAGKAADPPASILLPGIGSHDPRVPVPIDSAPWRAIGKLQATSGNLYESCTGTLIAPALVLTAAHCVFNLRTQHDFPPSALHFLVGYKGDNYIGHAVGRRIEVGAGYNAQHPDQTRGSDWALIALEKSLGSGGRILPLAVETPQAGSRVMLGGYSQDYPYILMADTACRIVGRVADAAGHPLLRDDCTGGSGVSGAPLLIKEGSGWSVAAIAVAAEMGTASGIAVLPDEARQRIGAIERGAAP